MYIHYAKKHTQYRLSIFIGLLSLNTLSSCVNTRHQLGIDNTPTRQEEQSDSRNSVPNASRFHSARTAFWSIIRPLTEVPVADLLVIGEGVAVICAVSYALGYSLSYSSSYNSNYALGYTKGLLDAGVVDLNRM